MDSGPPEMIAIDHDDYHAKHIGNLRDGRQFFLTTPFEPATSGQGGSEFVALYIFDSDGNLLEALIDDFGPRDRLDRALCLACYEKRLSDLGDLSFGRIEVKPFALERFGRTFGLVVREPDDEDDEWAVELLPGNYMAFFAPWDSGEYDT